MPSLWSRVGILQNPAHDLFYATDHENRAANLPRHATLNATEGASESGQVSLSGATVKAFRQMKASRPRGNNG